MCVPYASFGVRASTESMRLVLLVNGSRTEARELNVTIPSCWLATRRCANARIAAIADAIGRPAMDRRDRKLERPVVEHGAVDERHRRRIDAGVLVMPERFCHERVAPRPCPAALRDDLVDLRDLGWRKRTRE